MSLLTNESLKESSSKKLENTKNIIKDKSFKLYCAIASIPFINAAHQHFSQKEIDIVEVSLLALISALSIGIAHQQLKEKDQKIENISSKNERLKKQIINLKDFINEIPSACFAINKEGKYEYANGAFAKMAGKPSREIIGLTNKELFPLTPQETIQDLLEKNKKSLSNQGMNELFQGNVEIMLADGNERVLMLEKAPFGKNGDKIMLGVCFDITDMVQKEKRLIEENKRLEEDQKIQSSFLSIMSHEIRTPINAIFGFSDLMRMEYGKFLEGNRSCKEVIDMIGAYNPIVLDQTKKLLDLINDILDLSKIKADAIVMEEIPVNIGDIIKKIVDLENKKIKDIHGKNNIEVRMDSSIENLPNNLIGDSKKIGQIITNLVVNAVKFTREGSIDISCKQEETDEGLKITFYVKDTGIGIKAENLEKIFDEFKQADASSSREYGGTGLGLSIAKGFAKRMNGDIMAESDGLDKGSTFIFSCVLPYETEEYGITKSLSARI